MSQQDFRIVGVGASAGGQDALKSFFSQIPADVNAAFVVVTHLFRDFKSALPSIISRFTSLTVSRVENRTRLQPGNVYVMPEDVLMKIDSGVLMLVPRPDNNHVNNSIDVFFESLAEDQRSNAIAVVLSGMGSDGSDGALAVFKAGGDVLVQDPGSTKFNSMPIATILKDHPDFILPPAELGAKLTKMISLKPSDPRRSPSFQQEGRINLNS
ncbi:MAG TPA: chemotaxis protein CheB [Chryseosolibacter sp.]